MGMGYASACLQDEWSILNNPAGLSENKNFTSAFSYNAHPLKNFNRMAATFVAPIKVGVAGVGVFRFGNELYNEQIIAAGYSNHFGLASLGLSLNYIQYNTEGFGRKGVVTVSLGGIATLTPQLLIGAHITNVNQPEISDDDERVPTRINTGIGFKPSDKVFLCAEIEKELTSETTFKTGIEYSIHKKCAIRTGFNLNPDAGFIGFGFKPKKLSVDYALTYNLNTGINHQGTVGYKFGSR